MAPAPLLLLLIKLRHRTFGRPKKHHHAVLMAGSISDGVGGIVDHGPRPGHREEARVGTMRNIFDSRGSDHTSLRF